MAATESTSTIGEAFSLENPGRAAYQPLLRVAWAVSLGVIADRFIAGVSFPIWMSVTFVALVGWRTFFVNNNMNRAAFCLLAGLGSIGGLWHHVYWNWIDARDIGQFATADPVPVVLQGKIASQPKWIAASQNEALLSYPKATRSKMSIVVTGIRDGLEFLPARGDAQVVVNGQVTGLAVGDSVQLSGKLVKFAGPTNPGQFDFRDHFRGKRIRTRVIANHPDCIRLVEARNRFFSGFVSWLRTSLDQVIWDHVSPQRAALGSAMLLGNRGQLEKAEQEQFLISGTVHLLAISGLHVGILAGIFLCFPRLGLCSRNGGLLLTVLFVCCYAWLVEFRPPVVRAAILISIFCYCRWMGRKAFSFNSLALAALIVIAVNPTELFSAGAQLSFLAVGSLIYAHRWSSEKPAEDPLDRLIARTRPWHVKLLKWLYKAGKMAFIASAVIWLFALPIVALRFHVVAPIALVANPVLLIPITASLVFGFCVLIFGWLVPPLGHLFGNCCDLSLACIQLTVDLCEHVPGGHFWTAGPTESSLIWFYTGVLVIFSVRPIQKRIWPVVICLLLWLVLGWVLPEWQAKSQAKERSTTCCTFVEVGHGNCVLLALPQGHHVMYDCGSFGSPSYAWQSASSVLWHQRISHLDAIIISHADTDHFNGIPGLLERFSVGRVFISQALADKRDQNMVAHLLGMISQRGIPITEVATGDDIPLADSVEANVLNPPQDGTGGSDNSDSIVLELVIDSESEHELRILLPGDVETEGLEQLLSQSPRQFDLVMAPHHGSLKSRPADFIKWSSPVYFVVSNSRNKDLAEFQPLVPKPEEHLMLTGRDGAIRFHLENGKLHAKTWLQDPW